MWTVNVFARSRFHCSHCFFQTVWWIRKDCREGSHFTSQHWASYGTYGKPRMELVEGGCCAERSANFIFGGGLAKSNNQFCTFEMYLTTYVSKFSWESNITSFLLAVISFFLQIFRNSLRRSRMKRYLNWKNDCLKRRIDWSFWLVLCSILTCLFLWLTVPVCMAFLLLQCYCRKKLRLQ